MTTTATSIGWSRNALIPDWLSQIRNRKDFSFYWNNFLQNHIILNWTISVKNFVFPAETIPINVIVKATAGFAVCRLILKLLLFYNCLDFTQNLGETLLSR